MTVPFPGPYLGPETGQFDMVLAGHSAAAGLAELARIEEVQQAGRAEAATLPFPVLDPRPLRQPGTHRTSTAREILQ